MIYEDNQYKMNFDILQKELEYPSLFGENKYRIKVTILCNPHNPIGRCYTKKELLKFGGICLKNNLIIISDEIYYDLVFKGYKHISITSLSKDLEQNTITYMLRDKSLNLGGMGISFTIIPNNEWRKKSKNCIP